MAVTTPKLFDGLADDYQLEILNEDEFVIRKNQNLELKYNITMHFGENSDVALDENNPMNFFTFRRGSHGGRRITSPWKAYTTNPNVCVRNSRIGTSHYATRWGKKRLIL